MKFHHKWKGPYEALERTTEVNYLTKKPSHPRSLAKVAHVQKLKLYQCKHCKQSEYTQGQETDSGGCGAIVINSRTDREESYD